MAAFCTKCGAGLTPGVQFCTVCGSPVGSPAVPAAASHGQQAAYSQPIAYGQPVAVPVPPPANTNIVKIILIVVGALIAISLISVIVFMFAMSRIFHVNHRGDGVTISTPDGGAITTGSGSSVSEADLGVPIYPGASRQEGGMQINSANGSMVTVIYSTPDPVSNVVDFYKGKLGDNVSVIQTGTGAVISAGEQNKQGLVITVGTDTNEGGTKIAIMRTKSK